MRRLVRARLLCAGFACCAMAAARRDARAQEPAARPQDGTPAVPPAAAPDNAALFARWEAAQQRHVAGEIDAARAEMAAILAAAPDDYELARAIGRWLAEARGDFVGAEPFARRAAELKPQLLEAINLWGSTLTMSGKAAQAEETFLAATQRFGESHLVWFGLGIARGQQKKYVEARAAFERALALAPDDGLTRFSAGENLANLREYPAAERELEVAVKLDGHEEALWRLGDVQARQGRDEPAERALRLALQRGSRLARFQAALHLGMFLVERDRAGEALPLLTQAVEQRPASREAWRWLARAQRALGKSEPALRSMRRYQELRAEEDRIEEEHLLGLIQAQLGGTRGGSGGER